MSVVDPATAARVFAMAAELPFHPTEHGQATFVPVGGSFQYRVIVETGHPARIDCRTSWAGVEWLTAHATADQDHHLRTALERRHQAAPPPHGPASLRTHRR
ncbi:hypothetical protein [Streptomyces sp. AK02-01A]|uniref:hypothetical protein n=1 Tax=Streptomyces sp. AK02-01A TaxID=3028648 RepID=UPI0029BCDD9E|nr:hypothetical protein [Streptomyces sp. AK02-01A]MDX3854923.1 hypothetical protein [Streptomyces sp. AK02-01A]